MNSRPPTPALEGLRLQAHRGYAFLRLLSLDVVAGAVGSGIMVSRFVRADMTWPFYLVLGLSVWLIYTLDHLLDAYRLRENASTPRHQFHFKYLRLLSLVWLLAAIGTAFLAVWQLPPEGILFGLAMGGLTILHLLIVKLVGDKTSPFLIKEFGVAFIYSAGVWGIPILATGLWANPLVLLSFAQFLLLALTNLLEFSWFEVESDTQDGQTSFVRALGKGRSRRVILIMLGLTGLVIFLTTALAEPHTGEAWLTYRVALVHLLMSTLLAALILFPRYFQFHERYRSFGDGAFLIPFLSLWIMPA